MAEPKKQIVRATIVMDIPIEGETTVVSAMTDLAETIDKCRELTKVGGSIALIKISAGGKHSVTPLGDVK